MGALKRVQGAQEDRFQRVTDFFGVRMDSRDREPTNHPTLCTLKALPSKEDFLME